MLFNPPDTICIDGIEYPILTDFKPVLLWYDAVSKSPYLQDNNGDKWGLLLTMLCLEIPPNITATLEEMQKFLLCGQDLKNQVGTPCICFSQDYWEIRAGFRATYGINLDVDRLHWWDFRSLLDELPEETQIKRIMAIRSSDLEFPGEGATAQQKSHYNQMIDLKEKYRIKWL